VWRAGGFSVRSLTKEVARVADLRTEPENLLRGIYSETRHFGQPGHHLLMWFQRLRDHAVESGDP
jgi:hypothetical protein